MHIKVPQVMQVFHDFLRIVFGQRDSVMLQVPECDRTIAAQIDFLHLDIRFLCAEVVLFGQFLSNSPIAAVVMDCGNLDFLFFIVIKNTEEL